MNIRSLIPPHIIRILRQNVLIRWLNRHYVLKQKNFRVYTEITTLCNAKCKMCSRDRLIKENKMQVINMPKEILDKIIEDIKDLVKKGYHISFIPIGLGEPLLFPNLFSLFKTLKEIDKKIYIILTTNGVLLNAKNITSLLESEVDEITVSLNSDDRKNYKELMGIDTYEIVLKNTIELLKRKKNLNLSKPKISVQYLDSEFLTKSFIEINKFWQRYLNKNDKVFFHEIVSQAGASNFNNKLANVIPMSKRFPCPECWFLIGIHINGDIYPCSPIFYWKTKKEDLYLGNILNDSLYNLYFNNQKLRTIRENMLKNNYSRLNTCKKCDNIVLMTNPFFRNPITKKWL